MSKFDDCTDDTIGTEYSCAVWVSHVVIEVAFSNASRTVGAIKAINDKK
jgi:hypothetical protein